MALSWTRLAATVIGCAWLSGCEAPVQGVERGEHLFDTCGACHGPNGGGIAEYGAPAVAGMASWYAESQIVKFRDGVRGSHPDDVEGLRMRPMARSLNHEGDLASVVEYLAAMPKSAPAATLAGDAAKGKTLYTTCTACHQADGTGNEAMKAPALVGLDDWYIVRQLQNFKSGVRGSDATADPQGSQMRVFASTLADEAAMRDIAAYIQSL